MATVTEKIYANRVALCDKHGGETEKTDAQLTIFTRYSGTYTAQYAEYDDRNYLRINFPIGSSVYASTKGANVVPYIVVKSGSNSASGTYKNGGSASYNVTSDDGYGWWSYLPAKSYNNTAVALDDYIRGPFTDNVEVSAGVLAGTTTDYIFNNTYSANASAIVYGLGNATYKPYADVTWYDIVPYIGGSLPFPSLGSVINEKTENIFTWNMVVPITGNGTILETTTVIKWRVKNTTTVYTIQAEKNRCVIPANTFPNNSIIQYCIIATTSEGVSSSEYWYEFSTTDAPPEKPTELKPNATVINGNETNRFSWVHNVPTGLPQGKAELQYSTNNGGTWQALSTVNNENQYADIPADTLSSGSVLWRVRTYNTDNVASEFSDSVQIIVKAKPPAPTINTVDGKPFLTVSWGSVLQMGYRVVITDSEGKTEDTGERYGAEKTFTSKTLLADGEATVTVYVGNASGAWNSTTATVNIANISSASFAVRTERKPFETTFTFEGEAYITRNGELIGKGNGTFTDRAGAGRSVYNVIKLNNGYYTKSEDIVVLYDRIKTAVVYDVEANGEFIVLNIRKESPVIIDKGFSASVAYNNYCGAEYPTAYFNRYKNEGISLEVTRTIDNNTAIRSLLGKLCCLKDKQGESVYCVLNSINESVERWNDVSLSFTRVNYENGVNYEA